MTIPENTHSLSILYIEDNHQNQRLVESIISKKSNHKLQMADNGRDGIAAATSLIPDLILLDINLPDISGYDVIKTLKENKLTRAIPVIAITANATSADFKRASQEDFFSYITKPFKITEFLEAVNSVQK